MFIDCNDFLIVEQFDYNRRTICTMKCSNSCHFDPMSRVYKDCHCAHSVHLFIRSLSTTIGSFIAGFSRAIVVRSCETAGRLIKIWFFIRECTNANRWPQKGDRVVNLVSFFLEILKFA